MFTTESETAIAPTVSDDSPTGTRLSARGQRALDAFNGARTRRQYAAAHRIAGDLVAAEQLAIVDTIIEARRRIEIGR